MKNQKIVLIFVLVVLTALLIYLNSVPEDEKVIWEPPDDDPELVDTLDTKITVIQVPIVMIKKQSMKEELKVTDSGMESNPSTGKNMPDNNPLAESPVKIFEYK